MPPERVMRYINKLYREGRVTEALALLSIEWYQPTAFELYLDMWDETTQNIIKYWVETVSPVMQSTYQAMIAIGYALTGQKNV